MKILVIEDDRDLCRLICRSLVQSGHEADSCHTGTDGLFYARQQTYDVIILDRMLPELDGLSVLEALRRQGLHTPVILATALDGLHDRIDGLDAGADDYLVKPFAVEELMARIRAVTRRPGNLQITPEIKAFGLCLDPDSRRLAWGETQVSLSKKESALLGYFMKKNNYPVAPVVLGLILGEMFEEQFRRGMKLGGGTFSRFYTSPICWFFIALVVLIVGSVVLKSRKKEKSNA